MNDKKIKWLSIGVMALVAVNLVLIVLVILPKKTLGKRMEHGQSREHQGMGFLLKELDLDSKQRKEFRALGVAHRNQKEQIDQQLRRQKTLLVAAVMDKNDIERDSLLIVVNQLGQENERLMVAHFEELRTICTDQQAEKLVKILSKRHGHERL